MTQAIKNHFEFCSADPIKSKLLVLCPECDGPIITDIYRGETICETCGLVTTEKAIDPLFDKSIFTPFQEKRKSRIGRPHSLLIPNLSYHTFTKRSCTYDRNLNRALKWESYASNDSKIRNLVVAISELKRIGSNLRLSHSVLEKAMLLYRKVLKKNIIMGRTIFGMVSACLYYICRRSRLPIAFHEIANLSSINKKKLRNCYSTLVKEFSLKTIPLTSIIFVSRYVNELSLSIEIEKKVLTLLRSLPNKFLNGRDPKGICAGLIYYVCKLERRGIRQKQIAQIIGITEATVRARYQEIKAFLEKEPATIIEKTFFIEKTPGVTGN